MIFQTSAITGCSFYPFKYMSLTCDEQCTDMLSSLEASCDYPSYVLKTFCVCVCVHAVTFQWHNLIVNLSERVNAQHP